MTPAVNVLLSLILVALGILGVILSFLVTDRKKSMLSLGLAAIVIVVGLFQAGSQSLSRYRTNKRIQALQQSQRTDLEEIRKRLRERAEAAQESTGDAQKKK